MSTTLAALSADISALAAYFSARDMADQNAPN